MGIKSGKSFHHRTFRSLVLALAGTVACAASASLMAAENEPAPDAALMDLLQALEQETEIATKTKMNIDFVPGIVTVFYGDDLLARGVGDVKQALALIPGVELSISTAGQNQVFVRGIGTAFSSGKLKVLLNGVPFNATLNVTTTALSLPTEQIDRIEVIRGPGSAIYGEFAFSGVVNIITRQDNNQVYARYGSLGTTVAGGLLTRTFEDRDLSMSLSFSGTFKEGDSVKTGPDVLRNTPFAGLSNAPGTTNELERDTAVIFQSQSSNSSLSAQYVKEATGDYFGFSHALPSYESKIMRELSLFAVNAQTQWVLSDDLDISAYLGWHDFKLDSGLHEFYPPNINFGAGAFPNGMIGSPNYQENKYRLGAEVSYQGLENHDILAGVEWSYTKQGDTFAERNYDPNAVPPAPVPLDEYRGSENWLEEDLTRQLIGLFIQDQFSATEKLTVTAGLRFDTYDDVGNAFSPRIAAVYRYKEHQTIKAQYSSAFRPPTFVEIATQNNPVVSGNPDIESEYISTYELGYIFNDEINKFRTTLFYADLHDLILVDPTANTYINEGEVHVSGLELEYVRNFGQKFRIDANTAFIRPWNESTDEELADVASVTANIGLLYRITPDYKITTQYRYVGERQREEIDPRNNLDSYQVVDATFSASNVVNTGLTLRGGVKNLFDTDVVYPSPMVSFAGSLRPSYVDDYPRPGREFWLLADFRI